MSFALLVTMMLLGFSMAIALVLQPREESEASAVSHLRCQGVSLPSIRRGLLRDLNLHREPQLPAGELDQVRERWMTAFRAADLRSHDAIVAAAPGHSVTPGDGGARSHVKCCSVASQVFMKDLGWDSWVIYPPSLHIVQCVLCSPAENTVRCLPTQTDGLDAAQQVPCCQAASYRMVPVVYLDELGGVVISTVRLIQSCGCTSADARLPLSP